VTLLRLLLLAACLASATPAHAEGLSLLRVIDGDSLILSSDGASLHVRLTGVDAPEWQQEYGDSATTFVKEFLRDKTITMTFDKRKHDRYGRILGYVYADGILLNESLVRAGLAVAWPVPPNLRMKNRFQRAEETARKAKSGFWRQGGLTEMPQQYRRHHPRYTGAETKKRPAP
jgi:micrococcal nuclease